MDSYILKGGEFYIYIYQKTMSILNVCVYKKIMKKKYSTIDVEMYEIVKIQMHF
jgi:uncharacterized membrane protein